MRLSKVIKESINAPQLSQLCIHFVTCWN